jgi:hypothetical protein
MLKMMRGLHNLDGLEAAASFSIVRRRAGKKYEVKVSAIETERLRDPASGDAGNNRAH